MDLASVVAALASVGVRVSGSAPNSSVQVDSSRACPPGLAGPEPSGTTHDLGQHFQMADPISKPAWRYTIGSTPEFWLFLSSQNDALLGPQFHPPVWSIGGPISPCPQGARTQFQVVHSDISPRSCLLSCEPLALPWPGEPRVGMTPILVILASSPHLTNPWCPDAGTSEGTRLGEGSKEFVLEGHRVSCLVPTSGGSRRGVNFGDF